MIVISQLKALCYLIFRMTKIAVREMVILFIYLYYEQVIFYYKETIQGDF
jgi:hypothetical protein